LHPNAARGDNIAPMRFHSSISNVENSREAIERCIAVARDAMGGKIDLAVLFFTQHHVENAEEIVERLWLELDPQAVVGCSAEGVIGGDAEIERSPGVALLVGEMPDVRLHPFHVSVDDWKPLLNDADDFRERLGAGEETRALLGLGDPFTTPMHQLLPALDHLCPHAPLIGGMASAGRMAGENVLVRNDGIYRDGMVGLSISGPVEIDTIVSQGCRPLGQPMVVTKAERNVIAELGGKAALTVLRDMIESLPAEQKQLLQNGLLVGTVINEYKERFGRGDFLIRNLMGADQNTGAIAVADYMRTGQTIQFHVRDAATADEDLSLLLDAQSAGKPPAGGLLFSCNGRGTRLFESPNHDISSAHRAMPDVPLAGFFAAGELGPVGGRNFIHGHTASMVLFRPGNKKI
jgi:small ligand-binding sensory domain FIST